MAQARLVVCDHPLVQEKLAGLREKQTDAPDFRRRLEEASALMGYEVFRGLKTRWAAVRTPLKSAPAVVIDQPIVLAVVLRAGLGMLGGLLSIVPQARVGHIGLYRNEETLNSVRYYVRLPKDMESSFVVLCDPMLATGGSAVEAIRILKTDGARQIALMSLIAAKAGVRRVHEAHPDVAIYTAAVDPVLNKKGYILPGLGDAGDRQFATC